MRDQTLLGDRNVLVAPNGIEKLLVLYYCSGLHYSTKLVGLRSFATSACKKPRSRPFRFLILTHCYPLAADCSKIHIAHAGSARFRGIIQHCDDHVNSAITHVFMLISIAHSNLVVTESHVLLSVEAYPPSLSV